VNAMRIGLIHALKVSIAPIEEAFARLWPEARIVNLLEDSLAPDLARDGRLTEAMTERFLALARYQAKAGADGILFTCSAFGPCIEACARDLPIPVLKPNEAMIEEAIAATGKGGRIGLLSTFRPTLDSMPPEFLAVDPTVKLVNGLAEDGLAALNRGDGAGHDAAAASVAKRDLAGCDAIALAQFSLARAADSVAAATGKKVFTTPNSAVRKLRRLLGV